MKLEFSFFNIYSNITFHENQSSGSPVGPCGQTDGNNEANTHFLQLCKSAKNHSLSVSYVYCCLGTIASCKEAFTCADFIMVVSQPPKCCSQ